MNPETSRGAGEFISLVQALMRTSGDTIEAAYQVDASQPAQTRVATILKAAIGAGNLSDPAWAGNLAGYRQISTGFLESLRTASVFDRLLGDNAIYRAPLSTRLTVVTGAAVAADVGELEPVPIGKMSLANKTINSIKAVAICVLSGEILRNTSPAGIAMLTRELRGAIASATDKAFLSRLAAVAASSASSGTTAAHVLKDLATLLGAVNPKSGSKLYLVVDVPIAITLSTITTSDGRQAFPGMTPLGGEILGMPALVSDEAAASTMMLIDASGIAGDSDLITLDASEQAAIQMESAPDSPATASTTLLSLWQTNSRSLKCDRYFGFEPIRAAVATVTGVAYA